MKQFVCLDKNLVQRPFQERCDILHKGSAFQTFVHIKRGNERKRVVFQLGLTKYSFKGHKGTMICLCNWWVLRGINLSWEVK